MSEPTADDFDEVRQELERWDKQTKQGIVQSGFRGEAVVAVLRWALEAQR